MTKKLLFSFVVFLALIVPLAAVPQYGADGAIDLGTVGDVFFCTDPRLGIAEISSPANAANFVPAAGKMIWTGLKAPATWLRFTLPESAPHILVVRPSFSIILDHVAFYTQRDDGGFDEVRSGAMEARRPDEPFSLNFMFELPSSAFSGRPVYLRLSSATDVKVDVSLEKGLNLTRSDAVNHLLYGLIFGVILAMVVYGLFILPTLRDRAYLYYIIYSVSAGLWLFFVQGYAKLIFGQHPGFDQTMLWFWAGGLITSGAIFTAEFLKLKEGHRFLYPIFIVIAGLGALVSLAGLGGWNNFAFSLSHALGVVLPLLAIAAAIIRLVQGCASALFFLIAWALMAAGGLAFSLMGLKVLPVNFLTVNCMSIGTSAESFLFAIALADRFKRLEVESKRLEAIQAQYRELSFKDSLTGLYNKRYLTMKLGSAIKEAQDGGTPLSLILIDLDDLKRINDGFGHDRGDEILKTLAGTMTDCVREGDEVCRIGGDEFVVVLPKIGNTGACRVAERIRSRFALDSFREKEKLNPTISLGVAEYVPGEEPDSFQKRADEALYEAKRQGKDRFAAR
jgi:diguanylate cyclase (GGDEF)-like protein